MICFSRPYPFEFFKDCLPQIFWIHWSRSVFCFFFYYQLLKMFHTFFHCFYCWPWTSIYQLRIKPFILHKSCCCNIISFKVRPTRNNFYDTILHDSYSVFKYLHTNLKRKFILSFENCVIQILLQKAVTVSQFTRSG